MAWLFSPELAAEGDALGSAADHVSSPMPGTVTAVDVEAGAQVAEGQVLVVVEAMKMEHALRSPRDGVVATVHVAVGDQVRLGQFLAELEGA
jgi:3-methylcrotonyl-CoA carboxylase alpha subunit